MHDEFPMQTNQFFGSFDAFAKYFVLDGFCRKNDWFSDILSFQYYVTFSYLTLLLKMTNANCECPVCFEPIDQAVKLACSHVFHHKCISTWLTSGKNTCPCCRQVFDVSDIPATSAPIVCGNPGAHPRGWWIYPFKPELAAEYPSIIASDTVYLNKLRAKLEKERRINPDDYDLFRDITNEIQRYEEQHRVYKRGLAAMGINA